MDAGLFPCLGSPAGCQELMAAIRSKSGFCAAATWLVAGAEGCVATVQGIVDEEGCGGIQNLGVVPDHRGRGIGRALLLRALDGFASVGVRRAFLEVTARNEAAVRMYHEIGFRSYRTVYRSAEVPRPADDPHAEEQPSPVGMGL
jgi:ribosomal protein S18 acetylase RimI-like enzyme